MEFSECDAYNELRNGKYQAKFVLTLVVFLAHFYFVTHMPMYQDPSDHSKVMKFCRVDESVNPTP